MRPNIGRWIAKAVAPWLKPLLSSWDVMPHYGKSKPTDDVALIKRCESWVYKCAMTNANAVASIPLRLYVRGGSKRFGTKHLLPRQREYLNAVLKAGADDVDEVVDRGHPLLMLLGDANPQMTGWYVKVFTQLHLELIGNAYWYIIDNGLAVPSEIWPLMGQYVRIVPDEQEFIGGFLYGKSTTNQIRFEPDEVIQFSFPNPGDMYYGMSPLQAAVKAVDRSSSMSDYQQEFFDNSARVDLAINVPEGTPAAERQRLYKEWLDKYQGRRKRWLPLVLTGDMSVQELSFPPADTGIIEAAKFSREEIANIFGIPMTMLEISASRAEAEAQYWAYAMYTLQPRLRLMEETLNERLVNRFDDRLFLAFDDPVPENVELQIKEDDSYLRNFTRTVNEVRAAQGLEPVPWGEMPINPATGIPIGTEPAPSTFARGLAAVKQASTKNLPPMTHQQREMQSAVTRLLNAQMDEVAANIEREMGG